MHGILPTKDVAERTRLDLDAKQWEEAQLLWARLGTQGGWNGIPPKRQESSRD
jgi:hypothetical protein